VNRKWEEGVVERVRVLHGTHTDVSSSVTVINRWAGELDEYYPGRSVIGTNHSVRERHNADALLQIRLTGSRRVQMRVSGNAPVWEEDRVNVLFLDGEAVGLHHREVDSVIQVAAPHDLVPVTPEETMPLQWLLSLLMGVPLLLIVAIGVIVFASRLHGLLGVVASILAIVTDTILLTLVVLAFRGWVSAVFGAKLRRSRVREQLDKAMADRPRA
jgi:hypothetical protein